MNTPISAVIVNYNAGELLQACVMSLLDSALNIKVIVVDNASTDHSIELLPDSPVVQVVKNSENLGFSAGCNLGLKQSDTDYVLFLNPDCLVTTDALQTMLDCIQSQERIGMVGGLLINSDGSEQAGGRRAVPTPWRSFVRAFGLSKLGNHWPSLFFDFYLHRQPLPDCPVEIEAISGACMLVKRTAIDDVGWWDEGYFLHCEDLDWCMRFRQRDWLIMFVPNAKIVHALGRCSRNRRLFVEWHKHKGMIRFYRKFFRYEYPGYLMVLVILGVWVRFGVVALSHLMRQITQGLEPKHG